MYAILIEYTTSRCHVHVHVHVLHCIRDIKRGGGERERKYGHINM